MRLKATVLAPLMFASLILTGAGCGAQTPASNPISTNPTVEKPSATTSDACGNPYYPFKPGLAITYHTSSTAGGSGNSDYTIRTVDVVGTEATIRAEFADGATADMTADCSSGSVSLKGSSGLGAAVEGVTFKTTVATSSGTYMPADVKAGTVWNNSETIKMDMSGGPSASLGTITLTTTEESRAIGEESIAIPAGTFKAMKVEIKRTSTSVAKFGKIPPSTEKTTEWWAKGIGMIKSVTVSPDGTTTVEATSVKGQ